MQHSWIRSFYHAAKHESIAEAAEELNIVPSAISKQISELEKYYNIELFERKANKIELTHLGHSLKKIADRYFEHEEQVRDHLDKIHDRGKRVVNIGVENIHLMHSSLHYLRKEHSNFKFRIYCENHKTLKIMFLRNKIDILLYYSEEKEMDFETDNIVTKYICDDIIKFVYSKKFYDISSKVSLDTLLTSYPFIVRTQNSLTRRIFDNFCIHKSISPVMDFEVSTRDGVIEMVRAGLGIGTVLGETNNRNNDDISEIVLPKEALSSKLLTVQAYVSFHKAIAIEKIVETIANTLLLKR